MWSLVPNDQVSSDAEFFREVQARGFYSLLFFSQALVEENPTDPLQLWIVSNHLQQVESGDIVYPEKATLVGPSKVVPQEFEFINCHSVDLVIPPPGTRREEQLILRLVAELNSDSSDSVVAYRGQQRWVQSFEPFRLEPEKESGGILRQNGVYLITGGLGGIGTLLAHRLAQRAQARLVLTGRSAFPARDHWEQWLETHDDEGDVSRRIRRLMTIEELGSEVLALSADAADPAQMQSVIECAHQRFGQIHGVIHAAGMAGEKTIKLLSEVAPDQCEAQFRGKVYGLYVLEKVLRDEEFDFCLLFSSNASLLGGIGSLSYAAANSFMDSFAASRSLADGRRWISVNWDGWLLGEESRLSSSFQTSLDKYAMRPQESIDAFMRIISQTEIPQIAVSTGDLLSRISQWVARRSRTNGGLPEEGAIAKLHPRPTLGIAYVPPSNDLEETIARVWRELLGIDQLGIHDNFFDLGGNSLIALKIISWLKKELRVEIPVVSLFEGPSVKALAQIIGQLSQNQTRPESSYEDSHDRGERRRRSKIRRAQGEGAGASS